MASIKGSGIIPPSRTEYIRPSREEIFAMMGAHDGNSPPPPRPQPIPAKPAMYIKNGELLTEKSQQELVYGGAYEKGRANNLRIVAYDGLEGGVYVDGGLCEIENATISLNGIGEELGGGYSGVCAANGADVTVRSSNIFTHGARKSAASAEDNSVLRVYDSTLVSFGQPFGAGVPEVEQQGMDMMSPPKALEIDGNSRTHVTMSNSLSYYYDSTVICDGWAALSTDMSQGYVYLEANNCRVVAVKSGYGTYADTLCHDVFNRCTFDVANMFAILAGECDVTANDCIADCGTYYAMIHCVMGTPAEVGKLFVNGGSIKTGSEVCIIKSQNAEIEFSGVEIEAKSGILLHSIVNSDPHATQTRGAAVYGIHAALRDGCYNGDLVHEDPDREMYVRLESATLRGAVKNAHIALDGGSKWTATADSEATLLGNIDTAQIDAPEGVTVTLRGGEPAEVELASGGRLVVTA